MNQNILIGILLLFIAFVGYEKVSKYLERRRNDQAKREEAEREEERRGQEAFEKARDRASAEKQKDQALLQSNTNALNYLSDYLKSSTEGAARNYEEQTQRQKEWFESCLTRQEATINTLIAAIEANTAKVNNDDATKLLAGTLKACEAIAESTVSLKSTIDKFAELVGQKPDQTKYPENGVLQPPTEAEAMRHGAFVEAMLRGLTSEQAAAEADEELQKKTMFSGISFGE